VDPARRAHADVPRALGRAAPLALGRRVPAGRPGGALVPVGRGGERRAIAYANPASAASRTPRRRCGPRCSTSGPRRWPRAPAHPGCLPLRAGGRGGVDRGRRRPRRHAPRRPAAHRGLALARAPQHRRRSHGLAGRPRHPAGDRARRRLLRVRAGRDRRPSTPHGPAPSGCGATPACGRWAPRCPRPARSAPTAGPTPTPLWPPSSSWRTRASPAWPDRATPRCAYTNPASGADALTTLRMELHRLRPGAATARDPHGGVVRVAGVRGRGRRSSSTAARSRSAGATWWPYRRGARSASARHALDLFTFSDAPVVEALGLARTSSEGDSG
jgi:gentisate 1,2-dioxygenase